MPITFSPAVRDAWGEQVADEVARTLDETFGQRTVSPGDFREVLSRLDVIEERFDQTDGRLDRISARLNHMDERFDVVNDRLDRVHEAMRTQMRWTVGTIALFATIVTVLLAIAEFTA